MNKLQAKAVLSGAINAMLNNLVDMAKLEGSRADFAKCIELHTQALDRALDDVFEGGEEITAMIDEGASDYGRRRIFGCQLFTITAYTSPDGTTGFSIVENQASTASNDEPKVGAAARVEFNDGPEAAACRRLFALRARSGDTQTLELNSPRPLVEGDYGVAAAINAIDDEFVVDFRVPAPIDNFNEHHHSLTDDPSSNRVENFLRDVGDSVHTAITEAPATNPVERRHGELTSLLSEILIELQFANRRSA